MNGSLQPSIPKQLLLKYSPPKITIVYHFETDSNDKYYHEVFIDQKFLDSMTDEELCSHLFLTESYYFNLK